MFEVGDRVKAIESNGDVCVGMTGTVLGIYDNSNVAVEFDCDVNGHNADLCGNPGKDGYCWFMIPCQIEKYEYDYEDAISELFKLLDAAE